MAGKEEEEVGEASWFEVAGRECKLSLQSLLLLLLVVLLGTDRCVTEEEEEEEEAAREKVLPSTLMKKGTR